MGARTGKQFLAGLRKPREIWVGEDKVDDVVSHPAFAGAAQTLARDLRSAARSRRRLSDAGSRDRRADQREPHDPALASRPRSPSCLSADDRRVHGRSDGPLTGLHERHVRRLRRARRRVGRRRQRGAAPRTWSPIRSTSRRDDISLTHTIVHPTIDKATGDAPAPAERRRAPQGGRHRARHRRARRARSWRRSRRSPTSSPSIPRIHCRKVPTTTRCRSAIPMGTPGLKFLCRDSCRAPAESLRPSVVEPLRRAGRVRDLRRRRGAARSALHRRQPRRLQPGDDDGLVPEHHAADDDPGADQARVRLRARHANGRGDQRHARRRPSRCSARSGRTRSSPGRRFTARRPKPSSTATACGSRTAARSRRCAPRCRAGSRASNEILTLIGSHNLLATPSQAQLRDPKLRPLIDRYLRGANQTSAEERARVFRLAWDFVGSALASRNELYERFYLASGARNYAIANSIADKGRALRLVDGILGNKVAPAESPSSAGGQKINLILEGSR